jgi:sulfate transport system substrate-binding protein
VTAKSAHPEQAKAFVQFLLSDTAQQIFAKKGYRPVVASTNASAGAPAGSPQFTTPSGLFTINDLGGWTVVNAKFFDPTSSVMATIENQLGVPTKK